MTAATVGKESPAGGCVRMTVCLRYSSTKGVSSHEIFASRGGPRGLLGFDSCAAEFAILILNYSAVITASVESPDMNSSVKLSMLTTQNLQADVLSARLILPAGNVNGAGGGWVVIVRR